MEFSNEDIFRYLIGPLKTDSRFNLYPVCQNDEFVTQECRASIEALFLYGFDTEPYIAFNGDTTIIYLSHAYFSNWSGTVYSLAEKKEIKDNGCDAILFIDDNRKNFIGLDETYGRITYDGTLNIKTHKEILELLLKLILEITSAERIEIEVNKPCKVNLIKTYDNRRTTVISDFEFYANI